MVQLYTVIHAMLIWEVADVRLNKIGASLTYKGKGNYHYLNMVGDILNELNGLTTGRSVHFKIGRFFMERNLNINVYLMHLLRSVLIFLLLHIAEVTDEECLRIYIRFKKQFVNIRLIGCRMRQRAASGRRFPRMMTMVQRWIGKHNGYCEYILYGNGRCDFNVYIVLT